MRFTTSRKLIVSAIALGTAIAATLTYLAFEKPQARQLPARLYSSASTAPSHVIPISLDTAGQTINAAEVFLSFDPQSVRIDSVSKDGSILRFWITDEPKFSNVSGVISFAGGLPTPGFRGNGMIGTIAFTLLKPGPALLHFQSKSRVLLNDGKGTSVALTQDDLHLQ